MTKFDRRLKSKKSIDALFIQSQSKFVFPLKLVYGTKDSTSGTGLHFTVSVSKRLFKKAVHRNKIKRRIKEAVRLYLKECQKDLPDMDIMFIYVGKEILPYEVISKGVKSIFKRLQL